MSKQYIDALRTKFKVKIYARGGTNSSHGSPLFVEADCYRSRCQTEFTLHIFANENFYHGSTAMELIWFSSMNRTGGRL